MPWTNDDLILYHGCTDLAADAIHPNGSPPSYHDIDLNRCRSKVDFGSGFYTTTRKDQAENWANGQYIRKKKNSGVSCAAVIKFSISREALANLANLGFVWEGTSRNSDFWKLVRYCRKGKDDHQFPNGSNKRYDIVSGPVALPKQTLVVKDCDQFSFHTRNALDALQYEETTYGHPKF